MVKRAGGGGVERRIGCIEFLLLLSDCGSCLEPENKMASSSFKKGIRRDICK